MCLKFILKRSSERLADITYYGGEISDLIMVSLIANHNCSSISFDTAEYDYEHRKIIKKYKRSINKNYKDTFIIRDNEILVNSENLKNLKPFIKNKILLAVPPIEYDYDNVENFTRRFFTYESYTDEVLKLFDYFIEQVYNLQTYCPSINRQAQIIKLKNFIYCKNRRAWQKIFTELVYDKLQPESVVTSYFKDIEDIKKNLYLFDFTHINISLIKVENNEIKITDAFQKNKLVLLPYLMIWIADFSTIALQISLIYSSIFAL